MLSKEQNELIENNINLVYKFAAYYNITDEDDIADLLCRFCEIVELDAYDEDKGKFSTFVWASLNNFRHYRHVGEKAQKRNLAVGDRFVYLNKMLEGQEHSDTETQEIVEGQGGYFDEVELSIAIDKLREITREKDRKRNNNRAISSEKMLDICLYYYRYENGDLNITDVAQSLGTTKQTVFNNLKELRGYAKRYLE